MILRKEGNLQEFYFNEIKNSRRINNEYMVVQRGMSDMINYIKQDLLTIPNPFTDTELLQSRDPDSTMDFAKQILTPSDLRGHKPRVFSQSTNENVIYNPPRLGQFYNNINKLMFFTFRFIHKVNILTLLFRC